jgi:proteic killer suppression protein
MWMEVEFDDSDLERLETDGNFSAGHAAPIVRQYRKVLQIIRAAVDERDIRAYKSRHFEKLKGNRSHQYSLRLNDQWRLIIEIRNDKPPKIIAIVSIEDYHK